ncbi:MAG TPA: tetratricopeptide repeat protein [Polyangium sp.]|nr:tetratricopeptide repeat protein [Polyangium sp.]
MGGPVSEILAVFLSENANGNPYFAQEIMTFWLEANQTRNKKDKDKEDTGVSTPSIFLLPNDVNSLLIARLDRLEPKVKRVVQAASVLGREFELRVLSRMMDDDVHLEEHIRVGEEQRLWLAMSKGRYRFGNVLLRNAAYEMQSRARLQDLHRRAAQAIQEIYADDVDSHATALGRHFQRAGKVEEARDNFLKGARKAAERYAHGEAKRLYRAYFKLTKDPTDESVVVHYEFALRVLETQGRFDEAIEEHRRVIDEAQRLGDRASEALGHLGLGRVNWSMGKFDNARAHYEHALITAREAGSVWHEGKALLALARLHRDQGRVDHARTFFEHALHNARKMSNPTEERAILADLALVYDQLGHAREAMALREQAFAIARAMRQA